MELQMAHAERLHEQLEARHAAELDEARGTADKLRELLTAREAEAARAECTASEREKMLVEEHARGLDELRKAMTEELQQVKSKQVKGNVAGRGHEGRGRFRSLDRAELTGGMPNSNRAESQGGKRLSFSLPS